LYLIRIVAQTPAANAINVADRYLTRTEPRIPVPGPDHGEP
jgi:hypothetical protein